MAESMLDINAATKPDNTSPSTPTGSNSKSSVGNTSRSVWPSSPAAVAAASRSGYSTRAAAPGKVSKKMSGRCSSPANSAPYCPSRSVEAASARWATA